MTLTCNFPLLTEGAAKKVLLLSEIGFAVQNLSQSSLVFTSRQWQDLMVAKRPVSCQLTILVTNVHTFGKFLFRNMVFENPRFETGHIFV